MHIHALQQKKTEESWKIFLTIASSLLLNHNGGVVAVPLLRRYPSLICILQSARTSSSSISARGRRLVGC